MVNRVERISEDVPMNSPGERPGPLFSLSSEIEFTRKAGRTFNAAAFITHHHISRIMNVSLLPTPIPALFLS
jgi:hypothetical protein